MDGISVDPSSVSVVGLCVGIVLAIARGWLVTARELSNVVHDRDEWRAESRIKDQQIAEKDEQLRHLREVGELTKTVLEVGTAVRQEPQP